MSSFDLRVEGKVALITGGACGIGRAAAEIFGEAGYRLVVSDVDVEAGKQTAAELTERGIEVEFVATDVADEPQVAAAVNSALERWDRLDFLFNNAGILGVGAPIEHLDAEDLDRVLGVDLKGVFYACKYAVTAMRKRGGGGIVNVASITAGTGSAYYSAYGAAKAGVISLTRGLARNIGRFNIRINCISPGSILDTELGRHEKKEPEQKRQEIFSLMKKIPLGRPGKPRDVAHLALFLASPLASHIHGAVLTVDGGELLGYQ